MAQRDINRSTLTVTALVLSNPTAQSFHLFQNTTVGNKSKYHPQLDAFNASLSLDGSDPFAFVQIPAVHATESATSIVDQDVQITNAVGFTQYNAAVLSSKDIKIRVKGRVGLKQGSLPKTTVDYNKIVALKGFDGLSGFNVTSFSIKLPPEADGTNMLGQISIPNPSVITISMGNVTFDNYLPATDSTPRTRIGTSLLNNLTLTPGDNMVSMRSTINQTAVLGAVKTTYKDGMLPVEIVGNSSIYNGEHLPYIEKPLQMMTQKITLNVLAALQSSGLDPKVLAGLLGGPS